MSTFWQTRIANANAAYQRWESDYKCKTLEDYFRGKQWKNRSDVSLINYNPYVLNLVYSTIESKLSSLMFQNPSFLLQSRPGISSWAPDVATQSAELKQEVLNTIVQNPRSLFTKNVKRSARDSFFRFGILEVGYAADWRNPLKDAPVLSDHDPDEDKEEQEKVKVVEDNEVPVNERLYFKRIPPKRFRVSVSDAMDLADHEWCGYFEFYETKVLQNTRGIKFPEEYNNSFVGWSAPEDGNVSQGRDLDETLLKGQVTKVWHIWDIVGKRRLLLLDGSFEEIWGEDCDRVPLVELRWVEEFEGFYPIPPVYQWLSSQDEINETREQQRSFRRRFTRKFQYKKGNVQPDELTKFTSGPDGVCIEVEEIDAIQPILNPDMGSAPGNELILSKDDFYTISGNSSNMQASDRQTATQSKIVAAKAEVRESAEQMDFKTWMCSIGRETLLQAQEYLTEGLWVKYSNFGDQQGILTDMQAMAPAYKHIQMQEIADGYDFEVAVDVMNQTPAALAAEQQAFVAFNQMLVQFPALALSPVLIRKAANVCGFRDEKVIQQMQQAAMLAMAAKASQAAGAQGQTLGQAAGTAQAQMATPGGQQIDNQLENQLPIQ